MFVQCNRFNNLAYVYVLVAAMYTYRIDKWMMHLSF